MSIKRNCPRLEAYEALNEYRETFREKQEKKRQKALNERVAIDNKLYSIKEKRYTTKKAYSEFCSRLKNELFTDALKGVYISALRETVDLTENGVFLANNIVENFVKESGGADEIIRKIEGKTYALDFLVSVVEGTYESILEDVDKENPESFEASEEKKDEMFADMSKDEDITNAVNVIAKRVTDAEEEFIKKNNEDKEALKDLADKFSERIKKVEDDGTSTNTSTDDTDTSDSSTDNVPDSTEADEEVPDSDNAEGENTSTDEPTEDGSASADTSTDANSKTDDADTSEKDETVKQESVLLIKAINDRREKRPRNVFEQVVINFTESVLKSEDLREEYIEDGKLDMASIIESSKCIYGFLEAVNTLQIHKVDADYIQDALENM